MNVYYFSSCMVPYSSLVLPFSVPFHSVPGVSLPRETFHTHTFSPSLSHLECWCGLFYSVLHSELQLNCYFITTFNKNQQVHETARKEWSCLPAWLPALVCCPSVCVLCAPCALCTISTPLLPTGSRNRRLSKWSVILWLHQVYIKCWY